MKYPFNKERAMKGEPVVNGRNQKVFDFKETSFKNYTIHAKVEGGGEIYFTDKGQYWEDGAKDPRDLFMLTPDPAPSAPMPFDWDKYNSGEWDAVYRDETKPAAIYYTPEAKIWKLVSIDKQGDSLTHRQDGSSSISGKENNYDLLLAPKQVTRWFNAYKDKYNNVGAGCTHDSEQDALANIDSERVHIGTYSFTTNAKP